MPALNIEYTEEELVELRAAAAADGKPVKAYVHDLSVREQQRRKFVAAAVSAFDKYVDEFDAAFPDDAPARRDAAA